MSPAMCSRVGVPKVFYSANAKAEEWINITPTTGGIVFQEHWKRGQTPDLSVKLTILGHPSHFGWKAGDEVYLRIEMPPFIDGRWEAKEIYQAKLTSLVHVLPTKTTPETVEYVFEYKEEDLHTLIVIDALLPDGEES